MKKQHLQSLKLNKKTISKMNMDSVKGGGLSVVSNCVSDCLGYECHVHK